MTPIPFHCLPSNVIDLPELRNRDWVFRDRQHAGQVLAGMLCNHCQNEALLLAIPAGGVPVADVLARQLKLGLDVVVVSKITLPWNTEAGYGAVAFDGSVILNEELISQLGLDQWQVQNGIIATKEKVERRLESLRGSNQCHFLTQEQIIVVDDGIASGFTFRAAIKALRKQGAEKITVAVPTAHFQALTTISPHVDAVFCANVRSGYSFAVADAYEHWQDVQEHEIRIKLPAP